MRVYTVHRRDRGMFSETETVLVKEGFCWPAFFIVLPWALWHGMWLAALILLAVEVGLGGVVGLLAPLPVIEAAMLLAVQVFIGFEANDWRRRSLERRGFQAYAVVVGANPDAAEWRFLQAEGGEVGR